MSSVDLGINKLIFAVFNITLFSPFVNVYLRDCGSLADCRLCVIMTPNGRTHHLETVTMYIYQTKIKLHETDAAGLLFFSNQFKIIHDAYEALLETIGFGFAELIRNKDFFLPIVHSESDYKLPLFVGDVLEVRVKTEKVGQTSFTLAYTLLNTQQQVVGTARTVHVTVDKKANQKIPLPQDMRRKIENLYKQDNP